MANLFREESGFLYQIQIQEKKIFITNNFFGETQMFEA